MGKYPKTIWTLVSLFVLTIPLASLSPCCGSPKRLRVEIISYLVRDRVIPLKSIQIRSMIIVAFKLLPKINDLSGLSVSGELYHNGNILSKDNIRKLDSTGNNLGFDIPLSQNNFSYKKTYGIPEGRYSIVIKVFNENHQLLTECRKEFNRNQIARRFYGFDKIYEPVQYIQMEDRARISKAISPKRAGPQEKDYIVFQKSYLERVYPYTEPNASDVIEAISAEISRNEWKPITFSLRSLRNLGKVQISVTRLRGAPGILDADAVRVRSVGQLTEVVESRKEGSMVYYRQAPKIIESNDVSLFQAHTQTYWMTLKIRSDVVAGDYYGTMAIKPQFGHQTEIPIHLRVLALRLSDTDIQYGMMATYAFYELDNPIWTKADTHVIKQRGTEIYSDLRQHGMTMVYPHSFFYLKYDANGQPVLDSLKASLQAYKALGFPGPFCWYLGHLLQTAKPSHPGSIINYDADVSKKRLQELLLRFESMARELRIPKDKLIVQLVDEADDKDRVNAGKELNTIAQRLEFKTLVTRNWPEVDIICTGIPTDAREAIQMRERGKQWWIYPNDALTTRNRIYARYVFGFGAWEWGVNGVVPWTYQMSQGCNGNPFTVLDGDEVMVAYPGADGPVPTPTWEVITDGINDYKYIYLLKQLISAAKRKGDPKVNAIERQLEQLKQHLGRGPGIEEFQYGDWSPESFAKRRKQIVEWALELNRDNPGIPFDDNVPGAWQKEGLKK